jgi:hypothetical protein
MNSQNAANPTTTVTSAVGGAGILGAHLPSIACLMVTLDALMVTTALPSTHRDLGGSVATRQSGRRLPAPTTMRPEIDSTPAPPFASIPEPGAQLASQPVSTW